MRVLHVGGGFAAHPLYPQLVRALRASISYQRVFAAVRSRAEVARQPADEPGVLEYQYRQILHPVHRVLFRAKIRTVFNELNRSLPLETFDVVHAHTLYSDGAVALRIKQAFAVPFLAAVRNTDVNFFMRLRPDLRAIGRSVLAQAARIVFLSPAYRSALLERLPAALAREVERKSVVVPNGIGPLWLEPSEARAAQDRRALKLLHVGDLSPNKNVEGILAAVARLSRHRAVELTLVGGGGERLAQLRRRLAQGSFTFARALGRIDDAQQLRALYREHDLFVMPSFKETFGIVYIEALSQGLPVIYTQGQGIDGFFAPGQIGTAVSAEDPQQIATAIEALAARIDELAPACRRAAAGFSWQAVAASYDELYRCIQAEGRA